MATKRAVMECMSDVLYDNSLEERGEECSISAGRRLC